MNTLGKDVKVGDSVFGFTSESHRVVSLEAYQHPTIEVPARIVHSHNGWAMTIFDTDSVRVDR